MELSPKDLGMSLATLNHEDDLAKARRIAHGIGLALGRCSINDIRRVWDGEFPSGNWCGSIFKDGSWERIGFTSAHHTESHAHAVSVWKFIGAKSAPSAECVAHASGEAPATPISPDLFKKQLDLLAG